MIIGTQIGQEQFICQDYRQVPYGSQRISFGDAQLGGFREDFVGTVGIVMGKEKAAQFLDDFEALVEKRAAAGAEKKVKPMIVGSMAIGAIGLLLGSTALVVAMRR